MFICQFCGKECKNANSHRNHERLCIKNENRKYVSHTLGKPAWNKGLRKEVDARVARPQFIGRRFGASLTGHSEETRKKISQRMSINNKGGRSKWYEVAGQKVQGTWERNIASKFQELGIEWIKLKTNRDVLEYRMDGKLKHYTPDFYLPAYNVYLEIKGYWWGRDKEKMDIVLETHNDKRILIVEKEQYEKILQGELVW
jgi:hypothetical protein